MLPAHFSFFPRVSSSQGLIAFLIYTRGSISSFPIRGAVFSLFVDSIPALPLVRRKPLESHSPLALFLLIRYTFSEKFGYIMLWFRKWKDDTIIF